MNRVVLAALLSHWRRHPLQLVTLVLGLALATALWSGVQAINAEAKRSYAAAAGNLGQATFQRLTGSDVRLEDFIALRRAGWQVSPVIEGTRDGLQVRGIEPLSAPIQLGFQVLTEADVALATFLGPQGILLVGPETVEDVADLALPYAIAASLDPGIVITDIAVAQRLLEREDLSYLLLDPDQAQGLPALQEVTRLRLETGTDQSDLAQLTNSFHLNLTAFGLLAFAVGLFIVQSAIGLAFEQRRTSFRTLRALGLGLRHLLWLLGLELATLALLSGMLGLGLGYAIAAALLPGVSGTLLSLYGADVAGSLSFNPIWALSALAMTFIGAAAAGGLALWRVGRLPLLAPAQPRAWARASIWQMRVQGAFAALLLAASALLGWAGDSLLSGFACLAALLTGAALALPLLLTITLERLNRIARGPLTEWLFADARQQIPALSLALMALLLALAANIGVNTMVGSFRTTFIGWLDQRLASELYVTTQNAEQAAAFESYVAPKVQAQLPIWSVEGRVEGQPARLYGIVPHETYRAHWPLIAESARPWDNLHGGQGALINEQLARRAQIWPGDKVALGPGWSLPVVGVYSDYGNPNAQVILDFETLRARFPDPPILRFALRVDPDQVGPLQRDLRTRFDLPPGAVIDQASVKNTSMRIFEQTFLVTGALNILTLGVAGFAILTSLLTLSNMRLTQISPVWALGLSARSLGGLEIARTALLALMTWVIAVPVGLLLAWVLLNIVNVHAFGWQLPMRMFPSTWVQLAGWALLAAIMASLWPARHLLKGSGDQLLRRFAHDR
ncbi:MAG: FtsX-like permease family protein [Pseudomonadota bacterium]